MANIFLRVLAVNLAAVLSAAGNTRSGADGRGKIAASGASHGYVGAGSTNEKIPAVSCVKVSPRRNPVTPMLCNDESFVSFYNQREVCEIAVDFLKLDKEAFAVLRDNPDLNREVRSLILLNFFCRAWREIKAEYNEAPVDMNAKLLERLRLVKDNLIPFDCTIRIDGVTFTRTPSKSLAFVAKYYNVFLFSLYRVKNVNMKELNNEVVSGMGEVNVYECECSSGFVFLDKFVSLDTLRIAENKYTQVPDITDLNTTREMDRLTYCSVYHNDTPLELTSAFVRKLRSLVPYGCPVLCINSKNDTTS